jgi:glucose 1-dehydrogenase
MQGLTTVPGREGATQVADVPAPVDAPGMVLVRPLEVGVCGTDREISEGLFGVAPDGEERLVLGHELLGRVEHDARDFARGDLVTATVRRSCGHCIPCA